MKYGVLLFCLFSAVLVACEEKDPKPVGTPEAINISREVETFAAKSGFSGSVLVAKKGELLYTGAFGLADRGAGTKNTVKTRYMIASMTKQFAAMAILVLEQRGLLSVDQTVDRFCPQLPHADRITIHHLLTHTSGLPPGLPGCHGNSYLKACPGKTNEEKLLNAAKAGHLRIATPPPDASFCYSDINYMLIGHIIEKASGMAFEEFLKKEIFIPLDMHDTGTGYDPEHDKMLATGYGTSGTLTPGLTCAEMGYGAGSMYSTVEDLYRWDRALHTETLVDSNRIRRMMTRYNGQYGYGWWFFDEGKGLVPVHGGRLLNGSFSGFFIHNTIDDICLVILGNDGDHDEKRDFVRYLNTILSSN